MTIELLLAPVAAGKTEIALERLLDVTQREPFARVWVLVATKRQQDAFRQRLVDLRHERRAFFNVEFFNFYQLYHRLMNMARQPSYQLDDTARFVLLGSIINQLQTANALTVYAGIAHTPGFVRIMAELIAELKQNMIPWQVFQQVAKVSHSNKDADLALIYQHYQSRLQQYNVVDREGEGWLALDVLGRANSAHIGRDVSLLLVDGYDQFSPLQIKLLQVLTERVGQALITLTRVVGREDTIGRRYQRTLEALRVIPHLKERVYSAQNATPRHPAIVHLVDHIFQARPERCESQGAVRLIEAPDPRQETAAVLRQVKRLLLNGTPPDEILIALRDWPRYAPYFNAYGKAYGLPLALHEGESIAINPAIMALMNMLSLHEKDFPRRDLFDLLQSPYFQVPGLGQTQIKQLEQISVHFLVIRGREDWLKAIQQAAEPAFFEDEDSSGVRKALLTEEESLALGEALHALFRAVTPTRQGSLKSYVYWLDSLIGPDEEPDIDETDDDDGLISLSADVYSLHMLRRLRQKPAAIEGVVERDLAAIDALMKLLRGLMNSQRLTQVLGDTPINNRYDFLLQLRATVEHTQLNSQPIRSGKVLVTTVADARGLPHQHVFIPGLSEGIFPAPVTENPLYLDSERQRLTQQGVSLQTQADRTADDGLFYELLSLARVSLVFSRPTIEGGSPLPASHLWRGVLAVLSDADALIDADSVDIGDTVPIAEVAARSEALLALADGLSKGQPHDALSALHGYILEANGLLWQRVNHARGVEFGRASRWKAYDRYSGFLSQPDSIAFAAEQMNPQRLWSASQLNDYGACGFRFFAKRLLKLEALEEPEEDLDAAKLGTINHAILERTYAALRDRDLYIVPENLETALGLLYEIADEEFAASPLKLGFQETTLWKQQQNGILRRLDALVRLDFTDSPMKKIRAEDRIPYLLEAPFSTKGGPLVEIPLNVEGKPESLHVQGFIDRMDRINDEIVLVDYKTGSTPIPVKDMQAGRNFQMMVYLYAAQQILDAQPEPDKPHHVAGGAFWHIRNQSISGNIELNTEGHAAVEEALTHISAMIADGRQGRFPVHPRKVVKGKCTHYCEYSQLCRVASTSRYKTQDENL